MNIYYNIILNIILCRLLCRVGLLDSSTGLQKLRENVALTLPLNWVVSTLNCIMHYYVLSLLSKGNESRIECLRQKVNN